MLGKQPPSPNSRFTSTWSRAAQRIRGRWNLPYDSILATLLIGAAVGLALGSVVFYFWILRGLPTITSVRDYRPPVATSVFAEDGRKAGEVYLERRKVVAVKDVPPQLIHAFIAAEDSRFYEHKGIDLLGILRAMIKNIEAGAFVQGGSTITQQVTKTFFLSPERTMRRKLKEAILSWRLEKYLNKEDILYLYINQIYLGDGAYGVEAAAETYFGKPVRELSLAECALLAGLAQAPSRYSPYENPQRARDRQLYVLNRMVETGYIRNEEASRAIDTPLVYHRAAGLGDDSAQYYLQAVRQYLVDRYGEQVGLGSGLKVYTAMSIEAQRAAAAAVLAGVRDYDRRHGYRGATKRLRPDQIDAFCAEAFAKEGARLNSGSTYSAVVVGVSNPRLVVRVGRTEGFVPLVDPAWGGGLKPEMFHVGDVIKARWGGEDRGFRLEQDALVQAALVSVEPTTGYVRALVGGTDYRNSQFNRATQSRRQPGSAFKPIIYSSALEKGYTPVTQIMDAPVDLQGTGEGGKWNPKNFEGDFYGLTLFRTGLIRSRNIVTVKILKEVGVDYVVDYARRLGIASPLNKDLSLALGSSGVSLLELTSAYAAFDNLGKRIAPILVTRVEDADGRVLEENAPHVEQAIDPVAACMMSHLLREVVESGTAWRAKYLGQPAAGKTGTTNNNVDAWYVGFTPSVVTGVWVGFDDERTLGHGEVGGLAAAPIWVDFMKRATVGQPVNDFPVAPGVVFARIDPHSGKLAPAESPDGVFEAFREGTAPTEYAPAEAPGSGQEDFFRGDMDEENAGPVAAPHFDNQPASGKWNQP